ncbi:MAG: alpha/beta hydrolase [Anaerolineales bacterium]|nr:alpha/beta hydrolase [Anaerolineales bacterium]
MSYADLGRHRFVATNGVTLHLVEAGPADGPLVLLLHGFPEFWWGWRAQIPALAAAGYRVVAPDQRGYFLSEKPAGVASYQLPTLAADIAGLIAAFGYEQAAVIGHDWGAAVAWQTALMFPQRVHRLGILNVPHPRVMVETLRSDPQQVRKSWYILAFQLRGLAERAAAANDWALFRESVRSSAQPGTFTDEILSVYQKAWSVPGALRSMMSWYRAAFLSPEGGFADPLVSPPTLILWGEQDQFLEAAMARRSLDFCRDGQLHYFPNASHWVQHEEAAAVNRRLLAFLAGERVDE